MEPLGAAGSILSILHASSKVIEYVNTARGATEDRARLRKELRACNNILQQIKDEADDSDEGKSWTKTVQALELPDGPLHSLGIALKLIETKLMTKDGLRRSLKWPFQEKEVLKIVEIIEREKELLDLALSNNTRKLIQGIERRSKEHGQYLRELIALIKINTQEDQSHFEELKVELEKVQLSQKGLCDGVDRLHARQNEQKSSLERHTILDWISPVNHVSRQQDIIVRRQAGTGKWLLDSEDYKNWMKTDSQTMFCPGIPGAGKTILTSIIVDNLREYYRGDASVAIAYVYCNFQQKDEQSVGGLFGSLLKQLAEAQSPLSNPIKDFYNCHTRKRTRPTLNDFLGLFETLSTTFSRVFILVDALDECSTANGHRAKFISELLRLQQTCRLNLLATSRFIPDISDLFEHCSTIEILASKDDVQTYLENNMNHLPSFVCRSSDLQESIKSKIIESTKGMFLLAKLHLDSLIGKRSPKAIRTALDKLATGSDAYDSAYGDAMTRIKGQVPDQEELAMQVLAWIVCARSPLTTSELREALGIEVGEFEFDEDNCPEIGDMVSVCAGLVTVDEGSDIIRLVHYTTQEYFDRTKSRWFPDADAMITEVCITYLSLGIFEITLSPDLQPSLYPHKLLEMYLGLRELNPSQFFHYAATNWGHHARTAPSTCAQVLEFLERPNNVIMSVFELFFRGSQKTGATGLHLASFFNLEEVTSALLVRTCDINPKGSGGCTPLHIAADKGRDSIAKLLIDCGADVNLQDNDGETPLLCAVSCWDESIVKMLLDRGADVNLQDKNGETPLLCAVACGNESTVKMLLDHGADVNLHNDSGETPLFYAASWGIDSMVKLLLDHGADVNLQNYSGETPLHGAVIWGRESIMQGLFDHGADVNLQDEGGKTPLFCAASGGDESIVKMLLDHGADINDRDLLGRTALMVAQDCGRDSIAQILRDRGAEDYSINT